MNPIDLTEFEDMKGFNKYLINKQGQIYSKRYKRFIETDDNNGYKWSQYVDDNGKRKKMSVHRLVALQYLQTDDITLEIDHIDRNRANNNVDNLRWVSHYDNCLNRKEGEGCIYQDRQYWKGRYSWNENGKNEIRQITREDKSEVEDWLEKIKLDHDYIAPVKSRKTIITEEDKELQTQRKKEYKDKYYADEANREKKRIKDKEYREKNKEKLALQKKEWYDKKKSLQNL